MMEFTKQDLEDGNIDLWSDWLRYALISFTSGAPAHDRVRAFAPLQVDPEAETPAGAVVREISLLTGGDNRIPYYAAIAVLTGWAPDIERWQGGALALQVAYRLGGRSLFPATKALIVKSARLPAAAKQRIAYLAVRAAEQRFDRGDIAALIRVLWQMDMLEPGLFADLALTLSRDDTIGLPELPRLLLALLPELTSPPHDGRYAAAISTRLLANYTRRNLSQAFAPDSDDRGQEPRFRHVLRTFTTPWEVTPGSPVVHLTQTTMQRRNEILQEERDKLNSLDDLIVAPDRTTDDAANVVPLVRPTRGKG